uniref:Uncharacterized protein n=1 Tax=Fagus sylvatica TaxID=28930 RepID=A0A2N9I2T6_FAGSY
MSAGWFRKRTDWLHKSAGWIRRRTEWLLIGTVGQSWSKSCESCGKTCSDLMVTCDGFYDDGLVMTLWWFYDDGLVVPCGGPR